MASNKHWWTLWSVGCEDIESVKLSLGSKGGKKRQWYLHYPSSSVMDLRESGKAAVAEFKAPCRPLNGLSPLETSRDFKCGFFFFSFAQCAKVNVAGGGLRMHDMA